MIRVKIGNCDIDILPIIKGLVSEADVVKEQYGKYDAYAVALGVEDIEAVKKRDQITDGYEVSELDLVYAHRLSVFGQVEVPTPAYCTLIDLCTKDMRGVIPLDMNDDNFTNMYIENVKATEYVKEHRLAKKGMKHKFDMTSPESFVMSWDKYINSVRGYRKISRDREIFMADQLRDIAKYRKSLLAVVEYERANNIVKLLTEDQ